MADLDLKKLRATLAQKSAEEAILLRELKERFNCDSVEEGKKLLEDMEARLRAIDAKLKPIEEELRKTKFDEL